MTYRKPASPRRFSRRDVLALGAGLSASAALGIAPALAQAATARPVLTRIIPRSGERLPVIGLGTAIIFDIEDDAAARVERGKVIKILLDGGARLIDTAPSYGAAESVLGDLLTDLKVRDQVFVATKFRASGRAGATAEMKESLRRLRTDRVELMQRHNIGFVDRKQAAEHLALVREWRQSGICRYIGVTHSRDQDRANARLIELMRAEKLDFIQVNYSMAERSVEDKLLAGAAETGTAVMVNLPYARGRLFRAVRGKTVPEWAKEFDATTWGQFFLKYILASEAVNVVLPGTDKPEYMIDNLNAGRGRLPDAALRRKMVEFVQSLS
jgi:aryl-alcohol dehydrogenase-like predicted oxidoreductase